MNIALPAGLSIAEGRSKKRVMRSPRHPFNVKLYPYELTPFHIQPVLPGETLKNLLLQMRCVSTALDNSLIGHHLEHYFFYVSLRQLADADDVINMLMDTAATGMTTYASDNAYMFAKSGAISWLDMCTDAVVEHWFRDEGDTAAHVGSTTGLPMVKWSNYNSWFDSLIDNADIETDALTGNAENYEDLAESYAAWEFMRQMQLTELSYEDYLKTFGVKPTKAEDPLKPELIRMVKNWTYPTNTVDGNGNINSQCSWSVQERADKDRFFKEPGFIVGYVVARPKVYLSTQCQSAVSIMDNAFAWLPATMKEKVMASVQEITAGDTARSPLTLAATGDAYPNTSPYWVDVRDLLVYGDMFVNHSGDYSAVRAEDITDIHGKKYPLAADLQLLGVSDTLTYSGDGLVTSKILGTQVDMT